MCCLRYEHETYEEAIKRTPGVGSIVSTPDGEGAVVETKPLAAEVRVKFTDNDKEVIKLYSCRDVRVIKPARQKAVKEDAEVDIPEN
jgi:cell fate regulator YaaT (PSP1 superfamily)